MFLPKNHSAVPSLKLYYFGPLRIELNGTPLTMRTTKTAALLAYLALEGQQLQPRTHLATLLWDGYEKQTARSSLRVALTYLRQALLPLQPIHILHKCVQWHNTPGELWSDVLAFEEAVLTADKQPVRARVEEAMALYTSEFLAGWENVDSAPFQKWVLKRRTHYQTLRDNLQQRLATRPTVIAKPLAVQRSRHNLRRPLTPLIGREEIVNALRQLLLDPQYPLLVLVGEGGIGKTRLALATAWSLTNSTPYRANTDIPPYHAASPFPDGIWFVSLNELATQPTTGSRGLVERIAEAIKIALSLQVTETVPATQQLLSWLSQKSLLLILDGFEHLTGADAFLSMVLETAYSVKVLVTSRRRLNLQAATTFSVPELAIPDATMAATATVEQLQDYPSVQLFVERAQRVRMDFQLDTQNSAVVTQICRLVGGIPLAIELAAAMMTIYTAPQLAEHLAHDAVNLEMTWPDLSLHHHSLERVMATSWQLLTSEEASLLGQCTVLVGTFTLAAVLAISEAKPTTVRSLIEKSLLRATDSESQRFTMHEIIRQYANRQFRPQPDLVTATRNRHAAYYLALLQSQEEALPNQGSAQQIIYTELDNIRTAWRWATESGNLPLLENSYQALGWFYRVANLTLEGFTLFAQASNAVQPPFILAQEAGQRAAHLRAMLLLYKGEFGNLAQQPESKAAITEAQTLGEQLADKIVLAMAARELAMLAFLSNDFSSMYTHAKQAVAWVSKTNNIETEVVCLHTLCLAAHFNQDYTTERELYALLVERLTRLSNRLRAGWVQLFLGNSYKNCWEYTQALTCLHEALAHQRELNSPSARYTLIALGHVWYALGAGKQAQTMFTEAEAQLGSNPLPVWGALHYHGLALVHDMLGNHATARQHFAAMRQITKERRLAHLEFQLCIDEGYSLLTHSAPEDANAAFQQAQQLAPLIGKLGRMAEVHAGLAYLHLANQDLPAVQAAIEAALQAFARDGLEAAWSPFRAYWYCYQTLQALHDERAPAVLAEAYHALMRIADKITDPTLKQSFLKNVPVNRALVSAMAIRT